MATKYLDKTGLTYFWSKIKAWCNSLFALDNAVVHNTGAESISGTKKFSGSVQVTNNAETPRMLSFGSNANGNAGIWDSTNSKWLLYSNESGTAYFKGTADAVSWSGITGVPSSFTPSSHAHGNITNDGKVGTAANKPLITGTNGVVTTGSFGTAANTFCQGNDSRLSDARTPTSHTHGNITNDGKLGTASRAVVTDGNKLITVSSVTSTELGYLSGTTSKVQTQLNAKAEDNNVLHLTGTEYASGRKVFYSDRTRGVAGHTSSAIDPLAVKHSLIERGVYPTVLPSGSNEEDDSDSAVLGTQYLALDFLDKNNKRLGMLEYSARPSALPNNNSQVDLKLSLYDFNSALNEVEDFHSFVLGYDSVNDVPFATCPPTREERTAFGYDIVTRNWIPKDTRIVHTTGAETISGVKTFSSRIEINSPYLDAVRFNYSDALLIPSTFPANTVYRGYSVRDGAGRILVECYHRVNSTAHAKVWQMHNLSATDATAQFAFTYNNSTNKFYLSGPAQFDADDDSTKIPNTAWIRDATGNFACNAATATKLATARTIAISGGATGTATSFDGSANITIPVTALDMSKANAGTLPVARGGTGLTSLDTFVRTTGSQSIAGVKTFTDHHDIAKEAINALRFRDTRVSTSATINTTTYQGMYWYNNDSDATASIYRRTDATDKTNALSFNVYAPDDTSANAYMSLQQPLKSSGDKGYLYLDGNFALNGLDIKKSTDNSTLTVMGGTDKTNNPYLQLNGKDASANKGVFSLWARDGTNNANLLGKPDGTLTWAGENLYNLVHRSGNETIAGSKTFTSLPIVDRTGSTIAAGALAHVLSCKYKNSANNVDFTTYPISVIGNDATNATNIGIRLGSLNGTTIVTAGECGGTFASAVSKYNDENLYLTADNEIQMYVKCSNDSTSYAGPIKFSGTAASGGTNSTTTITATTFNGNASTATTLSSTLAVDKGGTGATTLDGAGIVTKSGDQTVGGQKTFSSSPIITRVNPYLTFKETDWEMGVVPDATGYQGIMFNDKNDTHAAMIYYNYYSTKSGYLRFYVYNAADTTDTTAYIYVYGYATGIGPVLRPENKDTVLLGMNSYRWKEIWCTQNSLNSASDKRLKNSINNIPNEILDAWEDVNWIQYKFNDAVEEKGNNARFHCGLIAQDLDNIFKSKKLDISRYGLFLHDSWEASPEERSKDGELIANATEAGDCYGLRYTEALAVEAAYQRRKNKILENRISELEKQVSDMIILLQNLTNGNG